MGMDDVIDIKKNGGEVLIHKQIYLPFLFLIFYLLISIVQNTGPAIESAKGSGHWFNGSTAGSLVQPVELVYLNFFKKIYIFIKYTLISYNNSF